MNQQIKYYVTGHTSEGFVNFLSTNLIDIEKIIVLQHPSNRITSNILKKLSTLYKKIYPTEIILSAQTNHYIDGLIIKDKSLAIVAEPIVQSPLEQAEYVDLRTYFSNEESLSSVYRAEKEMNNLQNEAYAHFKNGLEIHDDLEELYINEMDFNKADRIAEIWINKLFSGLEKKDRKAKVFERLFGTNTSDGVVNVVEPLIEPITHRVFIKGRAGTGKSFFMKKLLNECLDYGIDVELYRCSFDPSSIDMLIIRELDYCLFDSTDPHEFFPSRPTDEVVDFYERTVTPGTDEKYEKEIKRLTKSYKEQMKAGVQKLKQTKSIEQMKVTNWHVSELEIDEIIQEIPNLQ